MKTTIDAAGRLVIPKKLREQAGLEPGMELEVRYCDGRIEVEPAEVGYHLEERDGFLVAVADGPMPALTDEIVNRVREDILDERMQRAMNPDGPSDLELHAPGVA